MSTADDLISFSFFFFLNSQLAKQTDFLRIFIFPQNVQNLEGYTVNFKHNLNFNHIIAY